MKIAMVLVVLACLALGLSAQAIRVHSPNGNETWVRGSNQAITWKFLDISDATRVKLVLFKDGTGPANKLGNIVQNIPIGRDGLGSHSWSVGNYEGGTAPDSVRCYFIRVITMDGTQRDESNAPFSISTVGAIGFILPPPPSNPNSSRTVIAPGIIIDSPRAGDQWLEGDMHDITWRWVGISSDNPSYPTTVNVGLLREMITNNTTGMRFQVTSPGTIANWVPNNGIYRWRTGEYTTTREHTTKSGNNLSVDSVDDNIRFKICVSSNPRNPGEASVTATTEFFRIIPRAR